MTTHLVQLTRHSVHEATVEVFASDPVEAKRLALDLVPDEGSREWLRVNWEVTAVVDP